MIADQEAAGYVLPPKMVAIGIPRPSSTQGQTLLRLVSGHEIEAPEQDAVPAGAGARAMIDDGILLLIGSTYEVEIDSKKANFKVISNVMTAGWPNIGKRKPDWIWPLVAFAAGVLLYAIARALGWIIDGFTISPSVRGRRD